MQYILHVDEETNVTWNWFLRLLRQHVLKERQVCLISDRHKGILNAIRLQRLWQPPYAVHQLCLRHVRSNFNTKFRNMHLKKLCWDAGSTSQNPKFTKIMISQKQSSTCADFDIRAQSLFIEEAQLVGIDKPKAELISKILDDHSQLKVVSVVGMGGLGKTTLVKKVYDDAAVKKQFQSHAWITVSQNFQFSDIIKNLIQQLYNEIRESVPPEVESMNEIMLSEFVRDFLQERRYILVLDDVWSIDDWEAIKCVLPDCNTASRVVLTTRIANVAPASRLGSLNFVYKMEPLSDKESWTLFCNRTFQSNDCPTNLEEIAKKVQKKCEGLPLAIVAIDGVLAQKDKENTDEWEMILHGFGGEADGNRIKSVLLLSYNDLPHYLKSCLLYLSIYPEDYPIDVEDILLKWIALGFVEEKEE
ncbi:disease resistance protein RPM1-like [Coffea eugenioides]|nr:disease resistance protein RPM1-like [Coffea eugenioides]